MVRSLGALLGPGASAVPAGLRTAFTLQAADLVGAARAPGLLRLAGREAPGGSFRIRAEELEAGPALRDGRIDPEVGSIDHVDPETRVEQLVGLRMVAAVRPGHPLTEGPLTPARLAAAEHVVVSRRGRFTGPLDTALAELGLRRRVGVVLPDHLAATALTARSDVVCLVPPRSPAPRPRPSPTTPSPSDCTCSTSRCPCRRSPSAWPGTPGTRPTGATAGSGTPSAGSSVRRGPPWWTGPTPGRPRRSGRAEPVPPRVAGPAGVPVRRRSAGVRPSPRGRRCCRCRRLRPPGSVRRRR